MNEKLADFAHFFKKFPPSLHCNNMTRNLYFLVTLLLFIILQSIVMAVTVSLQDAHQNQIMMLRRAPKYLATSSPFQHAHHKPNSTAHPNTAAAVSNSHSNSNGVHCDANPARRIVARKRFTPGRLCSMKEAGAFMDYGIVRCPRLMADKGRDHALKLAVARPYGILHGREFPGYEFDHMVRTCFFFIFVGFFFSIRVCLLKLK
jgi:hypothetical protein